MKKITLITLPLFLVVSTIYSQKGGVQFTKLEWEEVLSTASEQNKIIFLDAYTSWCQPCKKMDKQVFPQKMVGDFFNKNFINVKMDMEKGIGRTLQQKYEILFYPTLIFLSPDGTPLHRIAGFQSAPNLLKLGKIALNPNKRLSSFEKKYAEGNRDPEFLKQYTQVRFEAMDGTHNTLAEDYLATQEDWSTDENLDFIVKYVDDTDSKLFDYLVENREKFEKKFGVGRTVGMIEKLIYTKIYDDKGNASLEELDKLFAKAYPPERAAKSSARFKLQLFFRKKRSG